MFKQVFETGLVPYRRPEEWAGIPNGAGLNSLYRPELITPPREFAETLAASGPYVLYADRHETPTGPTTIGLIAWTHRIYWPGWDILHYRFDGVTGALVSRASVPWGAVEAAWTSGVQQGFDGRLWRSYLSVLHELSDDLDHVMRVIPASHFGRVACKLPTPDVQNDLIIMPSESVLTAIDVYRLSTGAHLRRIHTSDTPGAICPERRGRVFVLGKDKLILNLINVETGEIMATWKCPAIPGAQKTLLSWDVVYRRLLVYGWTPDATNGASTSRIRGYYPLPVATNLMTPIPLQVPRKGRTIPALTRVIGDAGEPVMSVAVAGQASGAATLSGFPSRFVTDGGYATFPVECADGGPATLDFSVTA